MDKNLWKKIWLFCLCLASLSLAWCFHIPDEDWLLSDGEVETWNVQKDEELEHALNSFMNWIDIISNEWNNKNSEENNSIVDDAEIINDVWDFSWDWISENGLDEEIFLQSLDSDLLEKIASNFQWVINEEMADEQENPSIVINEWFVRIFEKEWYKEIVNMWEVALKPLYRILYKSENNWLYEYLCARALQDISGVDFSDDMWSQWRSNAKEFLELFTDYVVKNK